MKFDKSGGYRWLDSFVMANIIQLGTFRFCEKFLDHRNDPRGRQSDQMIQAARSGKANIIEGSERRGTSKETEMKLTEVAKASLGELRGDYESWLLQHQELPWEKNHPEAQAVFSLRIDRAEYSDNVAHDSCAHILAQRQKFARWLDSDDGTIVANALLILISRTINMLAHQLQAQGDHFEQAGGFREQLHSVRTSTHSDQDSTPACPDCGQPMHRRKAKTGKNAGQEFWGCTSYPECKGIRSLEEKSNS